MSGLTKRWQTLSITLMTLFLAVFFVDQSNLLDIFLADNYIIAHPDFYISGEIDLSSSTSTATADNGKTILDNCKPGIIKKVLQDEDSLSTETHFPTFERLIKVYYNVNQFVNSTYHVRENLYIDNCSLLI